MSVAAVEAYVFEAKDRLENFHGNQLLFVGWDKHTLFYAPIVLSVSPTTLFGNLVETGLTNAYGVHPDFAQIDWKAATWLKSGVPWVPDFAKSLADNGLNHKDVVRFQTPGLTGIGGNFV